MNHQKSNWRLVESFAPKAAFVLAILLCFADAVFAQQWKQFADIEKAGWSEEKLEQAREFAANAGSGAVMIIEEGNVVAAWGNVEYPYKAASIRKSIYDAVIGAVHRDKSFDLGATIGEMGIEDIEPLSEQEKSATFENLMAARSGVYHGAAYETPDNAALRPKRGSAEPGSQWYYNNWDFNVVPFCFEKLSGTTIQGAFEKRIAKTLGLQDYRPGHFYAYLEPRVSKYPAITVRISARDLARIGQLYLNRGTWDGQQIIDEDWIDRSIESISKFGPNHPRGEGNAYGRLWWVNPPRSSNGVAFDKYHRVMARGTGGQIMVLFPEIDMLIVHMADTDSSRGVDGRQLRRLLEMIVDSRESAPADDCPLKDVATKSLQSAPKKFRETGFEPIEEKKIDAWVGSYEAAPNVGVKLYKFESRLFLQPLGMPYPDVELFQMDEGTWANPVAPVSVSVNESDSSISITFNGRTMTAKRK